MSALSTSAPAVDLLIVLACGVALFLANVPLHLLHLHFLYVAALLLAVDTAILIGASLWHPVPVSARAKALMWTPAHHRAETERLRAIAPWRNYRVQGPVLLILTAAVVVMFR